MGGGDEAHVDVPVAHVAQAAEAHVLDDLQELRLHLQVHVADLVEEQRCPRCATSRRPCLAATAPVKAPFSWPKSSVSRSSRREPGAVEVDEGLVGARRRSRAASGRALPCRCPSRPGSARGPSRRRTRAASAASLRMAGLSPEEGIDGLARLRRSCPPGTPAASRRFSRARSITTSSGGQLHRLGEELLGPLLDGLHREVDGAVAGEQDDGQARRPAP